MTNIKGFLFFPKLTHKVNNIKKSNKDDLGSGGYGRVFELVDHNRENTPPPSYDDVYIQDAVDNSKYNGYGDKVHAAHNAEVFLGTPRYYNIGLSVNF